ncbi:MAG: hypothetical protein ACYDCC_08080 [Actinomycetota bacterium]
MEQARCLIDPEFTLGPEIENTDKFEAMLLAVMDDALKAISSTAIPHCLMGGRSISTPQLLGSLDVRSEMLRGVSP